MEQKPETTINQPDGGSIAAGTQFAYLVPPNGAAKDEISLADLWTAIWKYRWQFCLITGLFTLGGLAYALFATSWYQADVLLAPAKEQTAEGLAGKLGGFAELAGFAGLAGIGVGGNDTAEAIAVLGSRDLTRDFITDQALMPVLFESDWDAEAGQWKAADPKDWPDIRDGVRYFDENVRNVREDRASGLVTLSIEWTDPELAAKWANMLVERVNNTMRQRALAEAEANVAYLRNELAAANVVTLQQAIGRLLEMELQKLMLARGHMEFAFRVIDRAEPPNLRSWPRRTLIVMLAIILGGILAVFVVTVRHGIAQPSSSAT